MAEAGAPGNRRTLIKVCGITRAEDAAMALGAGADWLGFVLEWDSPRRLEVADAAGIVASLPRGVAVAVLVSPTPERAIRIAGQVGAGRVQLHRVDPLAWPPDFPLPVIFAIPVETDGSLAQTLPREEALVLLDTAHPVLAGGTGERMPWETARVVAATRDVLLAGGLDAESVGEALSIVQPFGVDASSRLESAPGVKDPDKVRRFVAAVREHDARA